MFAGDTVHLAAQVTDANGTPVDAGPLTWTTGASGVATVSASGVAQGTAPGLATISAQAGAGRGDVVIAVLSTAPRPNREIAFLTEGTDARSEVHTIQPDGSDERLVSIAGEYAGQFTWSPDGSRLAVTYLQYNGAGTSGLYLSNADGSNPVRVFDAVYAPAWSPDGSRIAFSRCVSSINECDIYTISASGTVTRALTKQSGSEQSPQWSPDGRRIAYILVAPDGASLWVMDDDGSNQQQLSLPVDAFNPRWSPDGKMIAVDNGIGVWLVRADGSQARPLTANCGIEGICDASRQYTVPDWSFDGQKIAYQSFVSSDLAVAVSSVSGDVLSQGGHVLCCGPVPQWSPDGTMIAYIGTDPAPPGWPGIAVMAGNATGSQFITGAQNAIPTVSTQNPGGGKRWRP
jgi:Tol biopolymer transport system component